MSDWFRGTIEGAYVGTPARVQATGKLEVAPFDITLYRASISSIERIPPPEDEAEVDAQDPTVGAAGVPTPTAPPEASGSDDGSPEQEKKALALRQPELHDVVFLGVGSDDARDHHTAYDLRITDVRLLDSTESDGRLYGRLVGRVVGSLVPSTAMTREAELHRQRRAKRNANIGAWVESLRWVMIGLAAWLAFGLCGGTAGTLWLAVVLPSALLRLLLSGVFSPTHGARVFGWALVLASATLGGLLYYRVTTLECASALWWLSGMVLAVVVSAVLPSRYPFLWTKLVLATSTLCLCAFGGGACEKEEVLPSVISQGPRTDPDGRWPRDPGGFDDVRPHQSREFAAPISLQAALALPNWPTTSPPVVTLPLTQLLPPDDAAQKEKLSQLQELLTRYADRTIVLEVHGDSDDASKAMSLLERWMSEQFATGFRIELRAAGVRFPLVPADSPGELSKLNERLEVWLQPE